MLRECDPGSIFGATILCVPRLIPPAVAWSVHPAVAPKLVHGRTVSAT